MKRAYYNPSESFGNLNFSELYMKLTYLVIFDVNLCIKMDFYNQYQVIKCSEIGDKEDTLVFS